MKIRLIIVLILTAILKPAIAQESVFPLKVNGYISSMQSAMFEDFKGDWIMDNLIHNRLNFKLYAGSKMSFSLEMRNRIFTGDMVRMDSAYAERIGFDPGMADMSWNIINEKSILLNSTIDRLWFDINTGIIQLRIGRQRINWGQTFVWNPNDIFNAYSYFDFDYAERPGSDAVRLQIYPSYSSTVELVAKIDNDNDLTLAGLTRFNKWGYDFQFLGGYVNSEDIVLGAGWSGAIGRTSFRGEFSWFQPEKNFSDTTGTGLFTVGFDRAFDNNSMVQAQIMYCNNPIDFSDFESFYSSTLSSKDLAFSKFSAFGSFTIPFTPLLNIGLAAIWYPDMKGFFTGPTIDASLSDNIDFSFFWQYFNAEADNDRTSMNLGFVRIKYSF
jgi:hypothetical protein